MGRFRKGLGLLSLTLLSGCAVIEGQRIDQEVHQATTAVDGLDGPRPRDLLPAEMLVAPGPLPPQSTQPPKSPEAQPGAMQTVAFFQDEGGKKPPKQFRVPDELPGKDAPPIKVPEGENAQERYRQQLYPPLPALQPRPAVAPGPEGHALSLSDLQRLAEAYSPALKNAAAAVDAAKGAMEQSGAYPNPTFAFEHDTVQTGNAGYPGFSLEQVVKTGNKIKLQQASATMDLLNARLALRRARTDLAYQVRTNYFAVLSADESIRVNAALYRFIDGLYRNQIDLTNKEAAFYEPMLLRPLALQARLNYEQAVNQYQASWRQLSASMGLPEMPPSELEGRIDRLPVPEFDHDAVLARILVEHTDVRTAIVNIQKSHYQLALAKLVPLPDLDMKLLVQKDYTAPTQSIVESFTVALPIPFWDQNKGGIRQAHGQLGQAAVGPEQARNNLRNTLADAYNRYRTARLTVNLTRQQIDDQVRAYRASYERFTTAPDSVGGFAGIVSVQQTLSGYLAAYLTALGAEWQAVADIANLLQTDDLFQANSVHDCAPLPDLEHLLPLPEGHRGHPGQVSQGCVADASPAEIAPPPPSGLLTLPLTMSPTQPLTMPQPQPQPLTLPLTMPPTQPTPMAPATLLPGAPVRQAPLAPTPAPAGAASVKSAMTEPTMGAAPVSWQGQPRSSFPVGAPAPSGALVLPSLPPIP
jgi:cobalt-zinc-cadmium efflux system outer membrane protein